MKRVSETIRTKMKYLDIFLHEYARGLDGWIPYLIVVVVICLTIKVFHSFIIDVIVRTLRLVLLLHLSGVSSDKAWDV